MTEVQKLSASDEGYLNEEEMERLQTIIDELRQKLAKLTGETTEKGKGADPKDKVDILGYTAKDWEDFFKHLEDGELKLNDWQMALQLVGEAFGQISALMAAAEQREFKEYEKTAKKKKKSLENQLDQGRISQEQYNSAVQQIDEETDRRREEMEQKQAKRDKALSIFKALTNTAVAVTAALPNFILAGIVAAMGAVQVATIAATPLPGAAAGGFLVEREQDGRRYRAEFEPQKRGFVRRPTVITGEEGTEYIIPAPMLQNPAVAGFVGALESARLSGRFRDPGLFSRPIPGRAEGGYTAEVSSPGTVITTASGTAEESAALKALLPLLTRLDQRLSQPFSVSLTGKNGIQAAEEKYNKIRKSL